MKNIFLIACLMVCMVGCMTVKKKEEIFLQAQQIKMQSQAVVPSPTAPLPPEQSKVIIPKQPVAQYALPENEELVYKAKYLGISIGEFVIRNHGLTEFQGRRAYQFELNVKTLPFFAKIFKPKDRYVSYFDAQNLVVLRYEKYIKQGTQLESTVDFDYQNHLATYKNLLNPKEITFKIPDKIFDILSGGFYLRMIPLELGDTVEANVYADEKIYSFVALLQSKTTVNLPSGKYDAYLLKPYLFLDEKPVTKISAEVYFSTDKPIKPLRAVLKTPFGNVAVILFKGFDDNQKKE